LNELKNHLKTIVTEFGVRYVSPQVKEEHKKDILDIYTDEKFRQSIDEFGLELYKQEYKNLTGKEYVIGSYKKTAIGYGYKYKLKGKRISNPWLEFVKKNRGRFSSLKELSVLYHSKRK
jgi:hypothetical protein